MHPRTQEVLSHLDVSRMVLRAAVARVPEPLQVVRPGADRWSVAEVLEHLLVVEQRSIAVLTDRIAAARAAGLPAEAEDGPVVPTMESYRLTDRTRRISGGAASRPHGGRDIATLSAELDQTRAALRGIYEDADGVALSRVELRHPVFGTLNAYQWAVFIGSHEQRHAAQIDEIAGQLGAEA